MKTHAFLLFVGVLFAAQIEAQVLQTPPIDSPINGREVTLAAINEPTVGEGSTSDGVNIDQVFQIIPDTSDPSSIQVGAVNNEPVLSGRKMLSGRKLQNSELVLNGEGVQAGAGGNGVTTVLSGHGQSGVLDGQPTDSHIEPHQDVTTVTAGGQSVSTGAGVNPDQLAGESEPLVYTTSGRK